MKIQTRERVIGAASQGNSSTVISANPVREREMLDRHGNVIDPRTKQIIKRAQDNNK